MAGHNNNPKLKMITRSDDTFPFDLTTCLNDSHLDHEAENTILCLNRMIQCLQNDKILGVNNITELFSLLSKLILSYNSKCLSVSNLTIANAEFDGRIEDLEGRLNRVTEEKRQLSQRVCELELQQTDCHECFELKNQMTDINRQKQLESSKLNEQLKEQDQNLKDLQQIVTVLQQDKEEALKKAETLEANNLSLHNELVALKQRIREGKETESAKNCSKIQLENEPIIEDINLRLKLLEDNFKQWIVHGGKQVTAQKNPERSNTEKATEDSPEVSIANQTQDNRLEENDDVELVSINSSKTVISEVNDIVSNGTTESNNNKSESEKNPIKGANTSRKQKLRTILIGDSIIKNVNLYGKNFQCKKMSRPGATIEQINDTINSYSSTGENDVVIVHCGTNSIKKTIGVELPILKKLIASSGT